MRAFKYIAAIVMGALVTMSFDDLASAQKQPGPPTPAGRTEPSAVEACGEFRNAAKPTTPASGKTAAERAEQGYGRVASAGQLGIECAKALAKHFEKLRTGGGTGAWSEIEQELNMVIGTYRNLVVAIEGADGVYDQGIRAVKVLDESAADIENRRGKNHPNAIDARKTQSAVAASLEVTKKLKSALVGALDEMMGQKSVIAEAIGIQRYAAAQKALDSLNEGLTQVVDELVREIKKRPPSTPGG